MEGHLQLVALSGSTSVELSLAQREIWREHAVFPGTSVHTVGVCIAIDGPLHPAMFESAHRAVWHQHAALRLTPVARADGAEPVLVEAEAPARMVETHDLRRDADADAAAQALAERLGHRAIPLDGGPTFRFDLIRVAENRHLWVMCYHHINMDAWANGILVRDIASAYGALLADSAWTPDPAPDFRDVPAGDDAFAQSPRYEKNRAYWFDLYSGPPDRLVSGGGGVLGGDGAPGTRLRRVSVPRATLDRLAETASAKGTTLARLFIAAALILLHVRSGARDVAFGMPVLNRPTARDKQTFGLFALSTAPRLRIEPEDDLDTVLAALDRAIRDALRHHRFPLSEVGRHLERASRRVLQLFDLNISYERVDYGTIRLGEATAAVPRVLLNGIARVPVEIFVREYGSAERVEVDLDLSEAVFDAEDADRFAAQFTRVLAHLASGAGGAVSCIPLVDDRERRWLLEEVNATARDYGVFEPVHRIIERVAETAPEREAIRFEGETVSYGALMERSGALARRLRRLGVGPEVRVGVALDRSVELVVALLAVMRAGGAYVPLDPDLPADRLAFMIQDAAAPVVVTRTALLESLPEHGGRTLLVDGPARTSRRGGDEEAVYADLGPQSLAYVIYTSGSTGRPKGVMNHHGGLRNRLAWMQEAFPIGPQDRVLQKTPYTFDVSVWEFFWPLMQGACLVLAKPGGHRDPDHLAALLRDGRISVAHFVPSMLQAFLGHAPAAAALQDCTALRHVVCSGEALPAALADRFRRHAPSGCGLENLYGPTEAAIDVSWWRCGDPAEDPVPIGHAIANTALYVLDAGLEPVPVGVVGELWIGGVQVSRGYLGRPGLTAETFVADPHAKTPGARMYRTGDLARRRGDGALEYLGRIDHQVKLRGFRIELGEIETALLSHPAIAQAAVLLRADRADDPRLVAYVVAEAGVPADLSAHLRRILPEHMLPSDVIALAALPVTANGKLDRNALPAPDAARIQDEDRSLSTARGPEEEVACAVFAAVLGRDAVGPQENFFALGGHSLLAVQAVGRLRAALGIDIPANAVLADPTAGAVARRIRAARTAARPAQADYRPDAPRPASAAEIRLRFLQAVDPVNTAYNMVGAVDLGPGVDLAALSRAVAAVQLRHPSLHSVFETREETLWRVPRPQAVSVPPVEGPLHAAEAARIEGQAARTPFDLARDLPLRARLLSLVDGAARLVLAFHHAAADARSVSIFGEDLEAAYALAVRESTLGPAALSRALPAPTGDALLAEQVAQPTDPEAALARWRDRLAGAAAVLDLPRDGDPTDRGVISRTVHLDAGLRRGLARRAVAEGATLFMLLHAGLSLLLHRLTGQADVVVGTPVSLRGDDAVARTVGMLLNTVPLRLTLDGTLRVDDLIGRARETLTAAMADAGVPLDRIVSAAAPARSGEAGPLFQALLTTHPPHLGMLTLAGEATEVRVVPQGAPKLDLVVLCADDGTTLDITIEAAASAFSAQGAERFAALFATVLKALAEGTAETVGAVPLLAGAELARETSGPDARDDRAAPPGSILDRFRAIASAQAGRTAIEDANGRRLTYAELDALSDAVAIGLTARGAGRGDRIGLHMGRGADLIAAMLGVLKTGGAYVPLDPDQPAERIAAMVEDASIRLSVGGEEGPAFDALSANRGDAVAAARGGSDTAYVMFTSGSTGRPKGIAIPDRAVLRLAVDPGFARFEPGTRIAQVATTAFDAATYEIWCALLNGGTVVVIEREATVDPDALAACFAETRPDSLFLTASVFNRMARGAADVFGGVREVLFGGEAAEVEAVRAATARWPHVRFVNGYGPTEATTFSSFHEVEAVPEDAVGVPIGRPIRATSLYVLDAALSPVPRGVAGELYIGGDGLADGYVGRPELTAEAFLPDPFAATPGARMYRTGDRVRRTADGAVEYLGRMDRQIKLRGFRIEPAEVEAAIRACLPEAREIVVDVRTMVAGSGGEDRALLAWVTGLTLSGDRERAVRAALTGRLPAWMVPLRILSLDVLPLTSNGKLDTAALPVPSGASAGAEEGEAPRPGTEAALAALWSELLGGAKVRRLDGFFEAGGHSLLGVRLMERIRGAFGVSLPLRLLFEAPVLRDMAAAIDAAAGSADAVSPLRRKERSGPARPLSRPQARLALMDRIDGSGIAYTIPVALLVEGALDVEALESALAALVGRHEPLRTLIVLGEDGPTGRLADDPTVAVLHETAVPSDRDAARAALEARSRADARIPFDLAAELPIRAGVMSFGASFSGLWLTLHHGAADGQSVPILLRELAELYAAALAGSDLDALLPPLPVAYADWAEAAAPVSQQALADAVDGLEDAPQVLDLPIDGPRPALRSHEGGLVAFDLPAELETALGETARRLALTPFAILTAAYGLTLARLSGGRDVVLGLPVAGRDRDATQGLVGLFADTAVLRIRFEPGTSVQALLARVRDDLARALSQPVPFDALTAALDLPRDTSRTPVFQAMIALSEDEAGGLAFAGQGAETVLVHPGTAKFDLQLQILRDGGKLRCGLEYAADLFGAKTARGIAERYLRVLTHLVAQTAGALSDVPILEAAERRWLLEEVNATARDYGVFEPVHRIIERVAETAPEREAIRFEGETVSYGALMERSGALARRLRRLGVGPEVRVGVALDRSVELVVALLAVMRAGGAYVPLDPDLPADRLAFMIQDAAAPVVVTRTALLESLPEHGGRTLLVDGPARTSRRGGDEEAVYADLGPQSLAYVIYTSGSTGRPKGVMNHHGGLRNRLAWMQEAFPIGPQDRVLQKTPYTFDVSVWEFFWPLMQGACLVLAKPGGHRDPDHLAALLRDGRISVAHFVPSMLQAFLGHAPAAAALQDCTALRHVVCSGEALPAALADRFRRHAPSGCGLENLYGPTEAAIDVSWWRCGDPAEDPVPIGHAIANTALYVLDAGLEPVPVGVVGELWIGGVQVSRGYLGRPGLTAETFVADPHAKTPGARMYRTGDLARRRGDGALEYLGRIDHQVKLRGFRIELGEIETALLSHPAIAQAAVLLRADRADDPRLVAYVVAEAGVPADLSAHLRRILPEHMLPSDVIALAALPVTANGKLDRNALPAPDAARIQDEDRSLSTARGPEEEVACAVFAAVLGRDAVGPQENFFALGGHSLLAVQAVGRLRAALGIDIPANAVFEDPTARAIADRVRQLRVGPVLPIPRRPNPREARPSPGQRQLWFLSRMEGGAAYNVPDGFIVEGDLDLDALSAALSDIVARHEALRTVMPERDGEPVALIVDPSSIPVTQSVLSAGDDASVMDWFREMGTAPFDVERDLPIRVAAARLPDGRHALSIVLHHLATDGASAPILYRDLADAYAARLSGGAAAAAEPGTRFYDWASWQAGQAESADGEAALRRVVSRLADAPRALRLPEDFTRSDPNGFQGAMRRHAIPDQLAEALRMRARGANATLFMVLLAGLAAYLCRLSGEREVLIGTPVSARDRADVEGLVGFMVNTVPLRVAAAPEERLEAVLHRARREVLDAFADQDVPLFRVVEALRPDRDQGRTPLFRTMLVLQPADRMALRLEGARVTPVNIDAVSARYDLTFAFDDTGSGLDLVLHYAEDLFSVGTAGRLAEGYCRILEAMAGDPETAVGEAAVMDAQAWAQELTGPDACDPRPAPPGGIAARLTAMAAAYPQAVAIEAADGRTITYAEMMDTARRAAAGLRGRGVRRGDRVGLSMPRGPEQILAMVAVLLAGAAYVPLDPEQPAARLEAISADAGIALVLADAGKAGAIGWAELAQGAVDPAALADRTGADTAYVMFTSGSTGRPKGIAVPDRAVLRLAVEPGFAAFAHGARVAQIATTAFDAATYEIWCALLNGGTVVVIERDAIYAPATLAARLDSARPDSLFLTTAVFNRVAMDEADVFARVGEVLFGGEAVDPAAVRCARRRWPGVRFVHVYGPTEATTFASFHPVEAFSDDVRTVPIGRPLRATSLYVLDAQMNPVPRGVAGELFIGGDGLADGYVGCPGPTAEAFLPDPFSDTPGARMYRTGDLVRRNGDGAVEFLGRIDRQIKLRGFRIEPGEVEAQIRAALPEARDVTVDLRRIGADPALFAWVGGGALSAAAERALRARLSERLPAWMMPARIVGLDNLPLTANGKVDLARLDTPGTAAPDGVPAGFATQTERALAHLWSQLLQGAPVRPGDRFFDLGGHSLLMVRLVALVREHFSVTLSLKTVFEKPALEAMAAEIDRLMPLAADPGTDSDGGPIQRRARRGRQSEGAGGG